MCSCKLTHIPTGVVKTAQTRSRVNSYNLAYAELSDQVIQATNASHSAANASIRKDQVGSGMRGDKIRTIRFQDNSVVDHMTGKRTTADKYMKGRMDELWS